MKTKVCSKCGVEKELDKFKIRSDTGKPRGQCKKCRAKYLKEYEKRNAERIARVKKEYGEKNKEIISAKNMQKIKKQCAPSRELYRENHAHKRKIRNEYHKRRMENDIEYRLSRIVRGRLHSMIKLSDGQSKIDLIGCSLTELRKHLENKFELGMTWDNHGFDGWHIDHIIPLSSFDLSDEKEVVRACHYTNLQPLWAEDNFSKGDRLDWEKK